MCPPSGPAWRVIWMIRRLQKKVLALIPNLHPASAANCARSPWRRDGLDSRVTLGMRGALCASGISVCLHRHVIDGSVVHVVATVCRPLMRSAHLQAAALYTQAGDYQKTARFYYKKAEDTYYQANNWASYDDWRRARDQWDYFYSREFPCECCGETCCMS